MSTVTANTTAKKSKAKTKAKRRSRISEAVQARALTFIAIVGVTYLVSSLSGQVMVEKARQDAIHASQRALDAKKVEAELSKRLDEMTGFNAIGQWAETHNFKSLEDLTPSKQVAERETHATPLHKSEAAHAAPR
jgi:hypothetical protein